MGEGGSMLKPWRGAHVAVDRTVATILIVAVYNCNNCSGGAWREHGKIMFMCLNVDSMWGDVGIT